MGGKSQGLSPEVEQGQLANSTALTKIAQQQAAHGETLFNLTEPGLASAENFYSTLSTGDPYAIARAIAPATQQITQATQSAKKNIMQNAPSGGEKNLALEQADVAQGSEVGKLASGAYTGSFNALAQLAGQGVGESISAAGTGISGFQASNQGLGQLGQLQIEQKGAQLGALTSLAGDVSSVAGMAFL